MTTTRPELRVRRADWQQDQAALRRIRTRVFIEEQQVPVELEWDTADAGATHFLLLQDEQPIGCARLLPDGHIGRVAILPDWRGRGYGQQLMRQVMQTAGEQGHTHLMLAAQTHAIGFYEALGFSVCSAEYPDAGIPHVDMEIRQS